MLPKSGQNSAGSEKDEPCARRCAVYIGLDDAERATLALAASASILSGIELWSIRSDFRGGGILDPRVFNGRRTGWGLMAIAVRLIPELTVLQAILLWSLLFLQADAPAARLLAFGSLAISALLYGTFRFGRDGSDDMELITVFALSAALAIGDPWATTAALVCIAGTAMIAYFTAGAAKLAGRSWRNGSALPAILRSASYGSPTLGALASRHRTSSRLAGYSVVVVEVLFPFAVFIGGWPLLTALLLAAAFHIGVAFTMGLNRFVLAFLATYPAILWFSQQL